jgi:hypothetical protein
VDPNMGWSTRFFPMLKCRANFCKEKKMNHIQSCSRFSRTEAPWDTPFFLRSNGRQVFKEKKWTTFRNAAKKLVFQKFTMIPSERNHSFWDEKLRSGQWYPSSTASGVTTTQKEEKNGGHTRLPNCYKRTVKWHKT